MTATRKPIVPDVVARYETRRLAMLASLDSPLPEMSRIRHQLDNKGLTLAAEALSEEPGITRGDALHVIYLDDLIKASRRDMLAGERPGTAKKPRTRPRPRPSSSTEKTAKRRRSPRSSSE